MNGHESTNMKTSMRLHSQLFFFSKLNFLTRALLPFFFSTNLNCLQFHLANADDQHSAAG